MVFRNDKATIEEKEYPIEGVQFHPESILTEAGKRLLNNFVTIIAIF